MHRNMGLLLATFALMGATVPVDAPPIDPAAAIAAANAGRNGQAIGVFRMKIAAVGSSRGITFLNSNSDYRSEGNVTFSLSGRASAYLAGKAGVRDASALVGRVVTVAVRIERRKIVNVGADGRQVAFNRWGYSVRIDKPEQLVAISAN